MIQIARKDGNKLTQSEIEETKQLFTDKIDAFRFRIQDVFENWHLAQNGIEFSASWFLTAERNAMIALHAQNIIGLDGKPVKPLGLSAQKRIASAIIERCRDACELLKAGQSADGLGNQVQQLFSRFLSEPDRVRGLQVLNGARTGGESVGRDLDLEARWKLRADELRKKHPTWGDRSVAKKIDEKRFESVRKVIRKGK